MNNSSSMNRPKLIDQTINRSEQHQELLAKLDKLNNFDNSPAEAMEVIKQIPKTNKMLIAGGNNLKIDPIINEAKEILQGIIDRIANQPDNQRLDAIKAKLEILYNYENNPALGNQTLMSMPAYAEKIKSGKGVNMNAILAEAIESTQKIVNQLERNKKE